MSNHDDPRTSAGDSDSIYRAPASDTSFAPTGDFLAAYVGPKNADYYLRHFENFRTQNTSVSWNWPAFFLTTLWLLYRKMWLNALAYWLLLPIVLVVLSVVIAEIAGEAAGDLFYYAAGALISLVLVPMFANRIYYRHAQAKVDKTAARSSTAEQQSAELARIGGTSNVVLIVVPFIFIALVGILAAIAIPAYQDYTIRAQVSEGLNLSASAKAAVAEYFHETGELPANNEIAGLYPANSLAGNYVSSVAVNGGTVVITYGNQAHVVINGKTLLMKPESESDTMVRWSCSSPSIKPQHLPAACR